MYVGMYVHKDFQNNVLAAFFENFIIQKIMV